MGFHEFSWDSMSFHGISLGQNPMELYGIMAYISMKSDENSIEFYEVISIRVGLVHGHGQIGLSRI
jgi:hypothetical protein